MPKNIKRMPVPVLPTMVGAMTLSNVLSGVGFTLMRPFMMGLSTIMWCLYLFKIFFYMENVKEDYRDVVYSSLFPSFFMMMMLLGSFYVDYSYDFGKMLWSLGLVFHFLHILIFTYRFVIKNPSWDHLYPSWFVTYAGILVAAVVGKPMNEPVLTRALGYYGVCVYLILMPCQIYNVLKYGVHKNYYHTYAILLSPVSLTFVALVNSGARFPLWGLYVLYLCLLVTLTFIIIKLPHFFTQPWSTGYAGLTFPMSIATVASGLMTHILAARGYLILSQIVGQIQWIQICYTTICVGYVFIRFYGMWLKSYGLYPFTDQNEM